MNSNTILLIFCLLLLVLLVVWLIYRNIKDEDEYEKEMDDTSYQPNNHIKNNGEKIWAKTKLFSHF